MLLGTAPDVRATIPPPMEDRWRLEDARPFGRSGHRTTQGKGTSRGQVPYCAGSWFITWTGAVEGLERVRNTYHEIPWIVKGLVVFVLSDEEVEAEIIRLVRDVGTAGYTDSLADAFENLWIRQSLSEFMEGEGLDGETRVKVKQVAEKARLLEKPKPSFEDDATLRKYLRSRAKSHERREEWKLRSRFVWIDSSDEALPDSAVPSHESACILRLDWVRVETVLNQLPPEVQKAVADRLRGIPAESGTDRERIRQFVIRVREALGDVETIGSRRSAKHMVRKTSSVKPETSETDCGNSNRRRDETSTTARPRQKAAKRAGYNFVAKRKSS